MSRTKKPKDVTKQEKPLFDDLMGIILWFVHAMIIISVAIFVTLGMATFVIPNLGVYLIENAAVTSEMSIVSITMVALIPEVFFAIVLALADVALLRFVNSKLGELRQNMLNRAIIWYNGFKVRQAKKKLTK